MARYTGPVYKKSRRLGFSVLENGKEGKPFCPIMFVEKEKGDGNKIN